MTVYPNPVNDFMMINTVSNGLSYAIHTIDGKLIQEGRINDSSISVSELEPNIYFLSIDGKTTKFIKLSN